MGSVRSGWVTAARPDTALPRVLILALVLIGVCLLGGIAPVAASQDDSDQQVSVATDATVRVATKPLEPFVILNERGEEGFSIDLWNEIASRNGWQTEWVRRETVTELLDAVSAGDADAGIAGISVTSDREELFDFSHAMFDSGLQIMVSGREVGVFSQLRGLLSSSLLLFMLGAMAVLFVSGHLVWFVQRRSGRVPKEYVKGVGEGMWLSAATALAGDLGESAPRRPLGRLVAIFWILIGVITVAMFTALTTSRLTVSSIEADISSLADLNGKRVLTVEGSTADVYLDRIGLEHTTVVAIEDAYPLLRDGAAEAIVYDAPVLRHHVNTHGRGQESVVGSIFNAEAYGIALPPGSELREPINRTLLQIRADGTYGRLYERWFDSE